MLAVERLRADAFQARADKALDIAVDYKAQVDQLFEINAHHFEMIKSLLGTERWPGESVGEIAHRTLADMTSLRQSAKMLRDKIAIKLDALKQDEDKGDKS